MLFDELDWLIEASQHAHVPEERATEFRSADGGSTEREYLNLLYALVCATKARTILETGTFNGWGTLALARAALRTDGHVYTLDTNPFGNGSIFSAEEARLVSFIRTDSRPFLRSTALHFDFAFLDSDLPARVEELTVLTERGLLRPAALICIHDTSRHRPKYRDDGSSHFLKEFPSRFSGKLMVLDLPLSRGLYVCQVPWRSE